jgi:hypothetical protein
MNQLIRKSLDAIGAEYQGGELAWLAENNPIVIRQLNGLQDRVDAAVLSGDPVAAGKAATAWVQNWLFWIRNYKVQHRRNDACNKKNEQL